MIPHKFTYRAPQLRAPIQACLEYLNKKKQAIHDELNKDKRYLQEHPHDIDHPARMRYQNAMTKIKATEGLIKKYSLWLQECQSRSWFTKYVLDEGDLQELYQYQFTDSN